MMCNNSARDPKDTNYVGHEKPDRLKFASLFVCVDYYLWLPFSIIMGDKCGSHSWVFDTHWKV